MRSAIPPISYEDETLHPDVRAAIIQLSAWDSWWRVMRDHRRGRHDWCSGHAEETPWPCMAWQLADAARRLHESRLIPSPRPGVRR